MSEDENDVMTVGGNAKARLKGFVERIERLEEEKTAIADDIKDVYAESKGVGFDAKTIRKAIARRKQDRERVMEEDAMLELYEGILDEFKELVE